MKVSERGAVMIVVLFIVMVISIVSFGFLAKSDAELCYATNMNLKTRMDYLAESGLEHAKGMLLNPQRASSQYWTGAASQQITTPGNFFYDVTVSKTKPCHYTLTSEAYRLNNGQKDCKRTLQANLTIDPFIAFYQNWGHIIPSDLRVTGDTFCGDSTAVYGIVNGDVFSKSSITCSNMPQGKLNPYQLQPPVLPPNLTATDLSTTYFYNGSGPYSVTPLYHDEYDGISHIFPSAGANNPAKIFYKAGNLKITYPLNLEGTLVVKDDLTLLNANVTIKALKNMPALVVGHDLKTESPNVTLKTVGLNLIEHHIDLRNQIAIYINVNGALYILGDGIKNAPAGFYQINVFGDPDTAAISFKPPSKATITWTPAAGAFYEKIEPTF